MATNGLRTGVLRSMTTLFGSGPVRTVIAGLFMFSCSAGRCADDVTTPPGRGSRAESVSSSNNNNHDDDSDSSQKRDHGELGEDTEAEHLDPASLDLLCCICLQVVHKAMRCANTHLLCDCCIRRWVQAQTETDNRAHLEQHELTVDNEKADGDGTDLDRNDMELFRVVDRIKTPLAKLTTTTQRVYSHASAACQQLRTPDPTGVAAQLRHERKKLKAIDLALDQIDSELDAWNESMHDVSTSAENFRFFVEQMVQALEDASIATGSVSESVLVNDLHQMAKMLVPVASSVASKVRDCWSRPFQLEVAEDAVQEALRCVSQSSPVNSRTKEEIGKQMESILKEAKATDGDVDVINDVIMSACQLAGEIADRLLVDCASNERQRLCVGRLRFEFCGMTGRCPVCRHLGTFRSDADTDRRVEDLQVGCPVKDQRNVTCSWKGQFRDFAGHTHTFICRNMSNEISTDSSSSSSSSKEALELESPGTQ